jgi:ubiquinone/menaquinone biosynthesis C-methylase UbiE
VPLVQASAEAVPLADASFDTVFCDHGAMNFADPYRTVPEVARLLRPGGLFAFCHLSPIADLCWPDTADRVGDQLVRDYFGMHGSTPSMRWCSSLPMASRSGCSAPTALRSWT